MRVLALSGSLRRDSHNTRLLAGIGTLLPEGVEMERFGGLAAIPPYSEDDELTPPPAVVAFKEAIAGADALIISTPEYNASIPGSLKNALDWASRPLADSPLRGKPTAVAGVSTGMFGAVWAQAELRKVLQTIGAQVVDREHPIGLAEDSIGPDGLPLDADARRELSQTLAELLDLAQYEATSLRDTHLAA